MHDVIIIGQGLAGTTLAWSLLQRAARVAVVQAPQGPSASQVAAGLVTPVTGRNFGVAPDFARDRAAAAKAYRAAEKALKATFWYERPAVRLIQSEQGMRALEKRRAGLGSALRSASPPPDPGFAHYIEALVMPNAARLDVAAYIDASGSYFNTLGCLSRHRVTAGDLTVAADGITLAGSGLRARHVVWCGGPDDADNAWLAGHSLSPAKGEILTVQIDDFAESRTTHSGGHWLLPTDEAGIYRFGATYDHNDLTPEPTAGARDTLMQRLAQMIDRPFTVLDQQAGIRPVGPNRRPFARAHPVHARVSVFNGLGSRGVLWAPYLAAQLADQLLRDEALAP